MANDLIPLFLSDHTEDGSRKGRRALRDTHRRGILVCAPGGSNNRSLNRPAIGEQRGAGLALAARRIY